MKSGLQEIVAHLTKVQTEVGSEAVGTVTFAPQLPSLHLDRHITVAGKALKALVEVKG